MTPRRLVLHHNRSPGDICVLTGLVRDIAVSRPGEFEIGVDTKAMQLWENNPYVTKFPGGKHKPKIEHVKIDYGRGIKDQKYEPVHFLAYFHRDFERQCRVRIPLTKPYPDLHLSHVERTQPLVTGRYWVVVAGGKSDFPVKVWNPDRMQTVVDNLLDMGLGVVQVGATDAGHWHQPMRGALDLVGRTNLRELIRIIQHAEGVVCGITLAAHLAAALQKPCVVTAGGREAVHWESYTRENVGLGESRHELKVPHRFLHTIGLLDCVDHFGGCWVNKLPPHSSDKLVCKKPVVLPGRVVPLCMQMITPDHVMAAAMSYYLDGTLPSL